MMTKILKFHSIRWKLFIAVSLPLFIVSFLILGMVFYDLRRSAVEGMNHYMEELATLYAEKFDANFSSVVRAAEATAVFLSGEGTASERDLYQILRNNVEKNPIIYGSSVAFEENASQTGKKLFAPYVHRGISATLTPFQSDGKNSLREEDMAQKNPDYRNFNWYRAPRKKGGGYWTEPYFDPRAENTLICTYSVPVFSRGKFQGIVLVDIRVQDLQKLINKNSFVRENTFAILSREGRFVRHPDPKLNVQETVSSAAIKYHRPELVMLGHKMMAGEKGVVLMKGVLDSRRAILFYAPIPSTGWSFAAIVPENEVMLPVWKKLSKFGLSMVAGFVLIVVMLFRISSKITKPVTDLAAAIPRIGKGNFNVVLKERFGRDELSELTESFNKMAHDLQAYTESLVRETSTRQRMEGELQLVRNIQLSLFPKAFPGAMEFDLFAENRPAYFVAGDFYDFFFVGKDTFVFSIADVSGKGISAAMFMVMAHTLLRKLAASGRTPSEVIDEINRFLLGKNETGMFVTMFLGYYDIKNGTVRYANAGHPQPFCMNSEGALRKFGVVTGTPLGISDSSGYEEKKETLRINETLVLYTDGFTEARTPSGEFLNEKRFQDFIVEQSQMSPKRLGEMLFQKVTSFQQKKLADDLTLLVLRRSC
ncbi:MAG: SpoIIE family protein phosphatase [Candidatus Omnitrophota bacterium]